MVASPGSWSEWVLFPAMLKHHQKAPEGEKRDWLFSADGFASESGADCIKGPFLPCEVFLQAQMAKGQSGPWCILCPFG